MKWSAVISHLVTCSCCLHHIPAISEVAGGRNLLPSPKPTSKTRRSMSSTVLEQLRAEQEEIEALERAVVATLGEKPRNVRPSGCSRRRASVRPILFTLILTFWLHFGRCNSIAAEFCTATK